MNSQSISKRKNSLKSHSMRMWGTDFLRLKTISWTNSTMVISLKRRHRAAMLRSTIWAQLTIYSMPRGFPWVEWLSLFLSISEERISQHMSPTNIKMEISALSSICLTHFSLDVRGSRKFIGIILDTQEVSRNTTSKQSWRKTLREFFTMLWWVCFQRIPFERTS